MNDKALLIYKEVEKIIGQPLYFVGGCVRDSLLNLEPKDYDLATPLLPEEIETKIKEAGRRAYLTGKKFGTLGVKIEGELVEITTFRTEKYEKNNRKPVVEYCTSIIDDLNRRDFTINAMAWREGKVIDPHNGQEDLKNGIIRCVGNPRQRFREDPLRLLRAIRFLGKKSPLNIGNYTIEENTFKKLIENSYKILSISKERWMLELDQILLSDRIDVVLYYLAKSRLLNFMIPELALQVNYDQNSPYHKYELWIHTKRVVELTPKDINLRWAALLHDIGKPFTREEKPGRSTYIKHDYLGAEMVERIAIHLKWSNERKESVKNLVKYHMQEDSPLRPYDKDFYTRGV